MDGTLIDSGQDITVSVNYVRKTVYGLGPLTRDAVVEAINRDQRNLAMLFYNRKEYEKKAQQIFEEHYLQQCIQTPQVYPGIERLLDKLADGGVRLCVATNAPALFARRMLKHLGLADRFDKIIGSESVKQPKPHPAMLENLLQEYSFCRERDVAFMIGDSNKDMEAARRAGITGVFVTWGFSSGGKGAIVLSHPDDFLQWLSNK